jgi:hypothetical protein
VWRRATASGDGARSGLAGACAWLIERGWVRPTRDLDRLHAALCARGVARRFGTPFDADCAGPPLRDRDAVAARVRALLCAPSDEEPSL